MEDKYQKQNSEAELREFAAESLKTCDDTEEACRIISHASNNLEANDPYLWIREISPK